VPSTSCHVAITLAWRCIALPPWTFTSFGERTNDSSNCTRVSSQIMKPATPFLFISNF
jgi:hypothetical protein